MSTKKKTEILDDGIRTVWDGTVIAWFGGKFPDDVTAEATDELMELIVSCEVSDAEACGYLIDASGVRRALTEHRDALRTG